MLVRKQFNRNLTLICVLHTLLFVFSSALLSFAQLRMLPHPLNEDVPAFWTAVCFAGLIGAFLYFGRKCYSYQIGDKFDKIIEGAPNEEVGAARIGGYYLYLLLRPFAGIAIGPIAAMVVMGGISTISSQTTSAGPQSVSDVGRYIIYLAAFVGGYTSSDLFDGLAKFGKSVLRPNGGDDD